MKGTIGEAEVVINYGSPSVRGRTVWGNLAPLDDVWRTGANEATRITLSKDVMINGEKLPAGTYSLFTIPSQSEWIVIFNETTDQWGSFNYEESKDVLRVKAQPQTKQGLAEQMDFYLDGDTVILRWEKLAVPLAIAAG
jgi:hypothetical protein